MLHTQPSALTLTHTHTLHKLLAPWGAWDCRAPHPAPLYHQLFLQLKKHISSRDIFSAGLYVMVTAGYVMAVLLSCSST